MFLIFQMFNVKAVQMMSSLEEMVIYHRNHTTNVLDIMALNGLMKNVEIIDVRKIYDLNLISIIVNNQVDAVEQIPAIVQRFVNSLIFH